MFNYHNLELNCSFFCLKIYILELYHGNTIKYYKINGLSILQKYLSISRQRHLLLQINPGYPSTIISFIVDIIKNSILILEQLILVQLE